MRAGIVCLACRIHTRSTIVGTEGLSGNAQQFGLIRQSSTPILSNKLCGSFVNGKHISQAQRAEFSLADLHAIPQALCEEMVSACVDQTPSARSLG